MKKTEIRIYRSIRNENKYIEVHYDGYGHWTVRQFMFWKMNGIRNLLGDGCLHRWSKKNLEELLKDYAVA